MSQPHLISGHYSCQYTINQSFKQQELIMKNNNLKTIQAGSYNFMGP